MLSLFLYAATDRVNLIRGNIQYTKALKDFNEIFITALIFLPRFFVCLTHFTFANIKFIIKYSPNLMKRTKSIIIFSLANMLIVVNLITNLISSAL